MKGTVAYIQRHIKTRLKELGFKKLKYSFEKELEYNFSLELFITSVNYIDFQDVECSLHLKNTSKPKLIKFLCPEYFNEHNIRIHSFRFTQFDEMRDWYLGQFLENKYFVSNESEANKFVIDLNTFFDLYLLPKMESLTNFEIIDKLINEPKVFTSSVIKDVDFNRFFDGLIFSKMSNRKTLADTYQKYINYTEGWSKTDLKTINELFEKLKKVELNELLQIIK